MSVAACATSALVSTSTWVTWFTPVGLTPAPELAGAMTSGAVLWRWMLVASALLLAAAPFVLARLDRGAARAGSSAPAEPLGSRERWILLGLVVLGLAIRGTRLTESLWYDEIAAWYSYGIHGPGVILGCYFDPSNHVGHTMLTWLSVQLTESAGAEVTLRLPALLASLVAIVAMHGLTRRVADGTTALVAAGLMAVLPVPVLEGVESRGYSLMICFAALSTWALLVAVDRRRPSSWMTFAALGAAGAWAHPLTVFVPIGHGAWLLWRRSWAGLAALALAAALTVTLYAPVIPQVIAIRDSLTISGEHQPTLLGPEGLHMLLQLGGAWSVWTALPGLVLLIIGGAAASRPPGPRSAAIACLLGLPAYLIVVVATQQWTYARFALFAMPGAILLIALGIDLAHRRHRVAGIGAAAVLILAAAADLLVRPPKQPLRDAVDFVAASGPGQRVVVVGLRHKVLDVYDETLDTEYSLMHGVDLEAKLTAHRPAWVILYYPQSVSDETTSLLEASGFEPAQRFRGWVDWSNGDVLVYRGGSALSEDVPVPRRVEPAAERSN